MAYGFEVINQLGEIVVSSETPVYQELDARTVSGSQVTFYEKDTWDALDPLPYLYDITPVFDYELVFAQLPVGGWMSMIGRTNIYNAHPYEVFTAPALAILSDQSSLSIKRFAPTSEMTPQPSAFGLECYDATGALTFSAGRNLLACGRYTVPAGGTATVPSGTDWFLVARETDWDYASNRVLTRTLKRQSATVLGGYNITTAQRGGDTVYPNSAPDIDFLAF